MHKKKKILKSCSTWLSLKSSDGGDFPRIIEIALLTLCLQSALLLERDRLWHGSTLLHFPFCRQRDNWCLTTASLYSFLSFYRSNESYVPFYWFIIDFFYFTLLELSVNFLLVEGNYRLSKKKSIKYNMTFALMSAFSNLFINCSCRVTIFVSFRRRLI